MRLAGAFLAVLVLFHAVPFAVYGALSLATGLEPPTPDAPGRFMLRVLIEKTGHAVAFVGVFACAPAALAPHWRGYAAAWLALFGLGELAAALGPHYTWTMAAGGFASELIYLPAGALLTRRLLGGASEGAARGPGLR